LRAFRLRSRATYRWPTTGSNLSRASTPRRPTSSTPPPVLVGGLMSGFQHPSWKRPAPLGYGPAFDAMANIAAPLLAGFSWRSTCEALGCDTGARVARADAPTSSSACKPMSVRVMALLPDPYGSVLRLDAGGRAYIALPQHQPGRAHVEAPVPIAPRSAGLEPGRRLLTQRRTGRPASERHAPRAFSACCPCRGARPDTVHGIWQWRRTAPGHH
jgi:hypothetical protein